MTTEPNTIWIAFAGDTRIAEGAPREVAERVKRHADADEASCPLVLDAVTSHALELDLRGSLEDVLGRLEPDAAVPVEPDAAVAKRAPGRPKLGVVAREVTLLPRHWEWLAAQPGGASVTLRKLVEQARKAGGDEERKRTARESAYRFMSAVAGDAPGYEEALRALFAADPMRFEAETESWPTDVREHVRVLARPSFEDGERA